MVQSAVIIRMFKIGSSNFKQTKEKVFSCLSFTLFGIGDWLFLGHSSKATCLLMKMRGASLLKRAVCLLLFRVKFSMLPTV